MFSPLLLSATRNTPERELAVRRPPSVWRATQSNNTKMKQAISAVICSVSRWLCFYYSTEEVSLPSRKLRPIAGVGAATRV